jgi:hypothetical protein
MLFEVTEKFEGCFLGSQYIETWDGDTVTISDIVKKGIRPMLIGVDENGNLVPCEITDTFNNGVKKSWVDVRFKPYKKGKCVGKSGKLRVTSNHKIFKSNMSEVDASALQSGDMILMNENQLCSNGIRWVMGGLLGDGSIGCKGHFSYNESHTMKHQGYNEYIEAVFSEIKTSKRQQLSGKGSMIQHFKVFATNQLKSLREQWYKEDGVVLPKDLSWMDDFIVAKWYMDDGSLSHNDKQNDRANFSTNSFSKEDVQRLADKLKDMYGVDTSLTESRGWSIRINFAKGTIHSFWKAIAKHVHPSMRYKLPEEYRNYEFEHFPKVKYKRELIPVEVTSVEQVECCKKNFPRGSVGYDIETTTHNYFCGGVLVHNSSMTVYFNNGEFGVCSRNVELKDDGANTFWRVTKQYGLEEKLRSLGRNIAIQGELIGPNIQGNIYKLQAPDFYVFDMFDIDKQEYLSASERLDLVQGLQLKHTPLIGSIKGLESTQAYLDSAEGKSVLNPNQEREGLVFKALDGSFSFKAISNRYLLKHKD